MTGQWTVSAEPTLGTFLGSWLVTTMQTLPSLHTRALTEEVSQLKAWAEPAAKTKFARVRDEPTPSFNSQRCLASALTPDTQSSGVFAPLMTAHIFYKRCHLKMPFCRPEPQTVLVRNVLSLSPTCTFHPS